jgi:hypothetical protein
MQQESQKSISSAVFGLQDSLRGLQQKWTCLQKNNTESTSTSQTNGNSLFNFEKVKSIILNSI